jgi:hypothetical protein
VANESGQDCFPSCRLLHLASFMSPGRATDYRYAKLAALQALTNKVRRSSSLRPARAVLLDRDFALRRYLLTVFSWLVVLKIDSRNVDRLVRLVRAAQLWLREIVDRADHYT